MADPSKPVEDTKAVEEPKLTPAELKKRAKAEKQARRAAQKEQQGGSAPATPNTNGEGAASQPQNSSTAATEQSIKPQQPQQNKGPKSTAPLQEKSANHNRTPSQLQQLPLRRRLSQSASSKDEVKKESKPEPKPLQLLSHLNTQPRRQTMDGASKDVHPAVQSCGFQMSDYQVCGGTARCLAMMLAFKAAIKDYTTPTGTSLPRHLTAHYLSPQIEFLKSCRPLSESMGNAIRILKKKIVEIDPNLPEDEAKDYLCSEIDRFVHERLTVADQVIANTAESQIRDGSVVLTYCKSSIVLKTLVQAHRKGIKFRVLIVDCRPLHEGAKLATALAEAGIKGTKYTHFGGLPIFIKEATTVLLGAHSMLGNGALVSRAGTASVALAAKYENIPVVVCCESIKFSSKIALDGLEINEISPVEQLRLGALKDIDPEKIKDRTKTYLLPEYTKLAGPGSIRILNLMYDLTLPEKIDMVVTEHGAVPPSSVPVLYHMLNDNL